MIDSTNPRVMADNIRELNAGNLANTEAIEALRTYSTEETDTGLFFGDEHIYRKIIYVEALPNNTTLSVAHGITNFAIVTKLYGIGQLSGSLSVRPFPAPGLQLYLSDANLIIVTGSDLSASDGYFFIEYTKSAAPSALTSPAPDDTRSIEPEVREEVPEEEPVVEVKKTTRKKSTN